MEFHDFLQQAWVSDEAQRWAAQNEEKGYAKLGVLNENPEIS